MVSVDRGLGFEGKVQAVYSYRPFANQGEMEAKTDQENYSWDSILNTRTHLTPRYFLYYTGADTITLNVNYRTDRV